MGTLKLNKEKSFSYKENANEYFLFFSSQALLQQTPSLMHENKEDVYQFPRPIERHLVPRLTLIPKGSIW